MLLSGTKGQYTGMNNHTFRFTDTMCIYIDGRFHSFSGLRLNYLLAAFHGEKGEEAKRSEGKECTGENRRKGREKIVQLPQNVRRAIAGQVLRSRGGPFQAAGEAQLSISTDEFFSLLEILFYLVRFIWATATNNEHGDGVFNLQANLYFPISVPCIH